MAAAIDTFSELQTAVFSRLNRNADATDFGLAIAFAEAEMNRRLAIMPVRPMHTINASFTIDAETEDTPTDILDVDSFYIPSVAATILSTSPQNLQAMVERAGTSAIPAVPQYYAQYGTKFRFFPTPDQAYTATLLYWARVPNLTSGAPSNWMLSDHPDVYWHGILAHLYQQYFDTENSDGQAALFDVAIEKVLSAYPTRNDTAPLRSDISPNQLSGWRSVLV